MLLGASWVQLPVRASIYFLMRCGTSVAQEDGQCPQYSQGLIRDRGVSNGMDAPGQSGIECARVESARPTTANEESVQNEDYDDRHRSSKERIAGSRGG